MTEEERDIIRAISPEDAATDICDSLSHLLGRKLTAIEKHDMSIKAKYWFATGAMRQNEIWKDKLDGIARENLPSHKVDYSKCAGEPE